MALFDRNKPFIGSRIFDYILEIWDSLDAKTTAISAAQTTANSANTLANTANTTANSANTLANTANTTANTANTTATNCLNALLGFDAWFYGEFNFTGTPSNLVVTAFTNTSATNITYDTNGFGFPQLGKYEIYLDISGDCVNARTEWYQEITTFIQNGVITSTKQLITSVRMPPSGTWNSQATGSTIINVLGGDTWKMSVNYTALGSTPAGKIKVRIKKIP
jgi:hypothetical protein